MISRLSLQAIGLWKPVVLNVLVCFELSATCCFFVRELGGTEESSPLANTEKLPPLWPACRHPATRHPRLLNRSPLCCPSAGFHEFEVRKSEADSHRGSSVRLGAIRRSLAWPLRKDDNHKVQESEASFSHASESSLLRIDKA